MLRRATALKRICDRQRVQNAVIRYIIIISKEVQVFRVLPQEREEDGFAVDSIRIINEPLVYHFLGNAGRQGWFFTQKFINGGTELLYVAVAYPMDWRYFIISSNASLSFLSRVMLQHLPPGIRHFLYVQNRTRW